jgi:molybdate transport system regulatory protein
MVPRAALKVDFGTGIRLGPGKVRLLECIAQTGSISAAARTMEMSYRRAWLLVDELNGMFGRPVVETAAGGTGGGGAKITEFGKRLVSVFRDMEQEADHLVKARMAQLK